MRLARLPLIPVVGDGRQCVQPVHISDVAAAVLHSLSAPRSRQTLDLLGAETFTFTEWLQQMRKAQGLPRGPLLPVPFKAALALSYVSRYCSPILAPDNLRMLAAGYHADAQAFTQFLGRPPLPFTPSLFFTDAFATGEQP
jgi:nucleoside-diphosphate-sugar epimerase